MPPFLWCIQMKTIFVTPIHTQFYAIKIWSKYSREYYHVLVERHFLFRYTDFSLYSLFMAIEDHTYGNIDGVIVLNDLTSISLQKYLSSFAIPRNVTVKAVCMLNKYHSVFTGSDAESKIYDCVYVIGIALGVLGLLFTKIYSCLFLTALLLIYIDETTFTYDKKEDTDVPGIYLKYSNSFPQIKNGNDLVTVTSKCDHLD